MKEYAPEHLTDYAGKLPALIQMKEAEAIMRILCENSWLLPLKNCLSTTVMMKSKQIIHVGYQHRSYGERDST